MTRPPTIPATEDAILRLSRTPWGRDTLHRLSVWIDDPSHTFPGSPAHDAEIILRAAQHGLAQWTLRRISQTLPRPHSLACAICGADLATNPKAPKP